MTTPSPSRPTMVVIPDHSDDSYSKTSPEAKHGGIMVIEKSVWDAQEEFYASYENENFQELLDELVDTYEFDEAMENTLYPDEEQIPDMRVFLKKLATDSRFELGACPACAPEDPCDFN